MATQRSRKPQSSSSIQGTPTLITCTGKITIINPVVASKGKLPKVVDKRFLQGAVKARGHRRPGTGHLGHSGGWQDTEVNHTQSAIHLQIQQQPQTRGLEEDMSQRDTLQRSYGNYQRMESHQEAQNLGGEGNPDKGESAIEEQLNQTGSTLIPSGSKGVDQPNSPVASHHSGAKRLVAKSHNSSQYQLGVTTTNNHPPQWVLRSFQPEPKLWSIGHIICLWPILPFWFSMASCP
ncbi:hypothetical protein O181_098116 [Austropuccinia psidii MF-1]|uniref:Uncharacterized protein n=1 Tax=Austropuccinia psidii MF-1 TaxID=1389203 RepID=A0A9Q3JA97_9BASI|nr:hypothetical protein [Austropuccinia psidii MF-1]